MPSREQEALMRHAARMLRRDDDFSEAMRDVFEDLAHQSGDPLGSPELDDDGEEPDEPAPTEREPEPWFRRWLR